MSGGPERICGTSRWYADCGVGGPGERRDRRGGRLRSRPASRRAWPLPSQRSGAALTVALIDALICKRGDGLGHVVRGFFYGLRDKPERHLQKAPWRAASSLQRRQRAEIRDNCIEVRLAHAGVPREGHRRFQLVPVARDTLGDGVLDVRVRPRADSRNGV